MDYFLREGMDRLNGDLIYRFHCSCGEEIFPDCDASSVSAADAFNSHVDQVHFYDALEAFKRLLVVKEELDGV